MVPKAQTVEKESTNVRRCPIPVQAGTSAAHSVSTMTLQLNSNAVAYQATKPYYQMLATSTTLFQLNGVP